MNETHLRTSKHLIVKGLNMLSSEVPDFPRNGSVLMLTSQNGKAYFSDDLVPGRLSGTNVHASQIPRFKEPLLLVTEGAKGVNKH